jgi:hypothetical protein
MVNHTWENPSADATKVSHSLSTLTQRGGSTFSPVTPSATVQKVAKSQSLGPADVIAIQRIVGNRATQRLMGLPTRSTFQPNRSSTHPDTAENLSVSELIRAATPASAAFYHVLRQPDPAGGGPVPTTTPGAQPAPAPSSSAPDNTSPEDVAANYEADAAQFFETNMSIELRDGAGVEGSALGRRASNVAGDMVRATCEPFEKDQELDTNLLSTLFAVVGGGASVAEAKTSGKDAGGKGQANIGSRIVRAGLGVVQVWLPTLAGYKTVGSLKDAAIRELGEQGAKGGETGSAAFQDYELAVMNALRDDWQKEIDDVKNHMQGDPNPANIAMIARAFWPTQRNTYLSRLRSQYGSQSTYSQQMVDAITGMLEPRMTQLKGHLQEAKSHRQTVQALSAIGAGIAGGAAIGAGIGVWGGGVSALPGALIGGVVGLVLGIGTAIGIWSD